MADIRILVSMVLLILMTVLQSGASSLKHTSSGISQVRGESAHTRVTRQPARHSDKKRPHGQASSQDPDPLNDPDEDQMTNIGPQSATNASGPDSTVNTTDLYDADEKEQNMTSNSTLESKSDLQEGISAISNFSDLFNFTSSKNMTLADLYDWTSEHNTNITELSQTLNVSAALGINTVEQLENITSQLNISLFGDFISFINNHTISNVTNLWGVIYNITGTYDGVNSPKASTQPSSVVTSYSSSLSPTTDKSSTTVSPTTDEISRMETVTNDESWLQSSTRLSKEGDTLEDGTLEGTTLVYSRENLTDINLSDWTNKPEFGGLVAALVIGTLCVIVVVVLFGKRFYDLYQYRYYTKMDYLVNGMYN